MAKPLAIQLAFANLSGRVDPKSVYRFIESTGGDIETYELDSRKVSAAAIDYVLLLGAAGSVASLASLLWMAYEKFIAPTKSTPADQAGIHVALHQSDGSLVEFFIGKEYKDRELFIGDFTSTVTALRESGDSEAHYQEVSVEVKRSGLWIRRK